MKTKQPMTATLTKTIYVGKHDQHSLEVDFDIYSEPPDESVGYMTWSHEIENVYVSQFNGIKRIPSNNPYFRWLDNIAYAMLEKIIPELVEEEYLV